MCNFCRFSHSYSPKRGRNRNAIVGDNFVHYFKVFVRFKYMYYPKQFHILFFILVINQLDAKILFYNKFISCLYMFRAPCAHRQEVKIVEAWNKLIVKQNFVHQVG